jgi:hypothetical protein
MRKNRAGSLRRSDRARPAACLWVLSRVCLLLREAYSTFTPDRTASSSTRKISRLSAGTKQKSVIRSGRPCSTNQGTSGGELTCRLRSRGGLLRNAKQRPFGGVQSFLSLPRTTIPGRGDRLQLELGRPRVLTCLRSGSKTASL